ncbi:tyrosine-type recombinase/integrase [Neobacillus sp. NPDC093127]|uniref:tyrosine-type recombinase/integrase n=1 Tax=Neobacillus sp. NPDC093127 TaxID=3364296 RepID=UPI00381AF884
MYFPKIKSFAEIPLEKGELLWRTFIETDLKHKVSTSKLSGFRQLIKFISDFYDDREETEKDVWNIKKIKGAYYSKSNTRFLLNFSEIPEIYRDEVKQFIKSLVTKLSLDNLSLKILNLRFFLQWYIKNYPKQTSFVELNREMTEKYITYLYGEKSDSVAKKFNEYINSIIEFIDFLQIREHPKAPKKDTKYLFYREDFRKRNEKAEDTIKYIPESVLKQLQDLLNMNPNDLSNFMTETDKKIIPIVILLMASGFRGQDILELKYNTCLIKHNDAYYLQADINKTAVKNHRIPVDEEVAKLILSMIEYAKSNLNNKEKWLFPAWTAKRRGLPIASHALRNTLNRWAVNFNIRDENGQLFKFGNHQFRHTKAVELINSGMNLVHIQKWMAHASPEMTLAYARILDNTLREEWLQAKEKSVVEGNVVKVDLKDGSVNYMSDEDLLEWEYVRHNLEAAKVPMGYCMASKRMQCPFVETPCLTCSNFCTTPEMLPEFEIELERVEALVEKTKDMPIWNEKNVRYRQNIAHIFDTLKEGKIHHQLGKSARELPKSS